jgi:hypothetical protein
MAEGGRGKLKEGETLREGEGRLREGGRRLNVREFDAEVKPQLLFIYKPDRCIGY